MTKIHLGLILEFILFLIIIIFAIHPVENFDFWFHVKLGEHILQTKSLPFTDQFSHTSLGAPAIPYEWLFQVIIYLIYKTLGNPGVQALVAFLALAYSFIFRQILLEIFQVPLVPRLFLVGFSYVAGFDFWVERPQSVAYALFMITLYIILKRVFTHTGRLLLWLTIPVFFIWTNLHASMVLGLYLFFSFAIICLIRKDLKQARDLLLFGVINTLITLLPPLGIKTYQLLYLFFEKRDFIMVVISEWVPLYKLGIRYYIYLLIIGLAAASLFWAFLKKTRLRSVIARNTSASLSVNSVTKQSHSSKIATSSFDKLRTPRDDVLSLDLFFFLPFIPLGLLVISGVRQTQFSMPAILLCTVPAIQLLKGKLKFSITIITIITIIIFISLITSLYFYRQQVISISRLYPEQAIPFIKANLAGNMFNEYHMGGFLMYQLGPAIKTFIDGRTDMFLPQVLPEYDRLINNDFSDREFADYFNFLVHKYDVSWAILTTERFTKIRRLARIIRSDPAWHLVFFDDQADIYVRDDGKNPSVTQQFAIKAATPFGKRLYKEGQRDQAGKEYDRMRSIAPSAASLNALGFMLLEDKQFDQARSLFEQALIIDPKSAAPKMNLAELAAKDGNLDEAKRLYKQAINDEPDRGLAYLRLGQLIIESGGSKNEARKIWQKGLTSTPDEEVLVKLRKELTE
ncbi:tetratricopeptide repeat protein [Candidatus Microgenomates bacterium]|nr:tetratricopeptide repeat protein [Candidatus Microgenomates bacterium]